METINDVYENIRLKYLDQIQTYDVQDKEHQSRINKCKDQQEKIVKRLLKLEKKQQQLHFPYWTKAFLPPVLEELIRLTPEITWDAIDDLTAFGLRGECPFFGTTESGRTVGITFTCSSKSAELYYDTGKQKKRYYNNTIGDLNGFNNVKALVNGMDTLVEFIQRQATPLGSDYDFITENARVSVSIEKIEGECLVQCTNRDNDGNIYVDTPVNILKDNIEYQVYPEELKPIDLS